jgi:orotate phosphoribosyltransferase
MLRCGRQMLRTNVRKWDTAAPQADIFESNTPLVILSAVTAAPVMDLFENTGAYLRGHFRLTSGLHSGEYLQCAKVLAYPEYAEVLGRRLGAALRSKIGEKSATVVVSPAMGGIIIGHEVGRALGVPALFTERDAASREMTLRRGFEVKPGDRAVVIEDVITTGGSTKEVIRLLQSLGADVIAAGSIIDRSGNTADVGVERVALETMHPETYNPDDCPLCRQGLPVTKPGSRPT